MDVLNTSTDVFAVIDAFQGVQHEVVAPAVLDEHQVCIHLVNSLHNVFKLALAQVSRHHHFWRG